MSSFLRRGFGEHQRLRALRRDFQNAGESIGRVFRDRDDRHLIILPLVELSWADGRVTARESEAILDAFAVLGSPDDVDAYCGLMESLMTRPSQTETTRSWFRLNRTLLSLPENEFDLVADGLTVMARYVAEHSSNNLIGFLRGDGIGRDEESILRRISLELSKIRNERSIEIPKKSGANAAAQGKRWPNAARRKSSVELAA